MRLSLALLVTGCLAATAVADDATDAGLAQWLAAQKELKTWQADFTQTRTLPTLARPLTSTGRLWFRAPSAFRWELGDPASSLVVRSRDQVMIYYPRLKRAELYSLGAEASGPWRDAAAMFEAGFPRNRAALDERFRLLSADFSQNPARLKLEPRGNRSRQLLPELRLELNTNEWVLAATEFHFADGTILRNDFTNSVVNPPLPDERFKLQLGPEVKIVEPAR